MFKGRTVKESQWDGFFPFPKTVAHDCLRISKRSPIYLSPSFPLKAWVHWRSCVLLGMLAYPKTFFTFHLTMWLYTMKYTHISNLPIWNCWEKNGLFLTVINKFMYDWWKSSVSFNQIPHFLFTWLLLTCG